MTMNPQQPPQVHVRLEGAPKDKGLVRLGDFSRLCDNLRKCFKEIELSITEEEKTRADYRIVGLECSSAAIAVEPAPSRNGRDVGTEVIVAFREAVDDLESGEPVDQRLSYRAIESLRDLYKPIWQKPNEERLGLRVDRTAVTSRFMANVEKLLETPLKSEGTVSGLLGRVNVHNTWEFALYPPIGGFHVTFTFDEVQLPEVRAALKRNVTVSGTLYYRPETPFPIRGKLRSIEVHPDAEALPRLSDKRGIARQSLKGIDSVRAVRAIRDA